MLCRDHAQGRCRYGTACKFSHDIQEGVTARTQHDDPTESTSPIKRSSNRKTRTKRNGQKSPNKHKAVEPQVQHTASQSSVPEASNNASAGPSRDSKGGKACDTWKVGTCGKGVKCRINYEHVHADDHFKQKEADAKLAAEARAAEIAGEAAAKKLAAEARAAEIAREAAEKKLAAEARAAEIAREAAAKELAAAQARAVEIAREAAAKTVQSVVLGSIATFGAGLELAHLVTGFECCTLRISNLPPDVQGGEITAMFTERGLDQGRFHLISVKPMTGGKRLTAEIITDAESGKALSHDLGGFEFRDEILILEVSGYSSPGSMSVATERDVNVLTISWRAPSVCYTATCPASVTAAEKARELNRRVCSGRRVKVEVNTMPSWHFDQFEAESIKISSLSPSVTDEEVIAFSGLDSVRRLPVKGASVEDIEDIVTTLQSDIQRFFPGTLMSMEPQWPTPNMDGVVLVRARFTSWDDAHAVRTRLRNRRIRNTSFWFRLPSPTQFSIIISAEQFRAQRALFIALVNSIKDRNSCMLNIHEQGAIVRMRLSGSKKEAIGALKVRLESLIAGEKVDGWHRTLGFSGNAFVPSVFDITGALLRADWRRQTLKVYGQPKAVEQARELVKAELDRLSSMEYTKILAKRSVRFFVQRAIPELKETFGEDNIKFIISTRRITISGGEEARHALEQLIQDSLKGQQFLSDLSGQQSCPICYDDISSPLHLGCGHVYCAACMRHFLTSAADSGQFPLTCMGDESQCRAPIPIPTIQQFLPPASFNRLLEVAFGAHISRNLREFKYCKTPDCNQIYRSTDADTATTGQCPSCFTNICTSCHEDAHDGMSCDDYKRTGRLAEEERQMEAWLAAQGGRVKKCPSCQVPIEKIEGCNHMTCSLCNSHICWRCMGIFTADTIYEHMHSKHGTIHDDDLIEHHAAAEPDWFLEIQRANLLAEQLLEQERFDDELARRRTEAARRDEVARHAEIARRAEVARHQQMEDAAARRQAEATRRNEAARQMQETRQRAVYEANVQRRRAVYEANVQREIRRAQAEEESPGWGCTIM